MARNSEIHHGDSPEAKAIAALIRRAEDGDKQALAKVRNMANQYLPSLWESYGDVAGNVEHSLLKVVAGDNALQREAVQKKMAELRAELAGSSPSPLERLLVERIVICWLQMYYEDAMYAQGLNGGCSWEKAHNQQRLAERAQKRFLSAVKALATVRKLALPNIQVNVGAQQVNVANMNADPEGRRDRLSSGKERGS